MKCQDVREIFLSYYASLGYERKHSSSLVPAGDQTLLFTNAGMVPFKDYFLGVETPSSYRVCSSQKCVRAGGKHNDLDQVGLTARHHTFFEMLGNFIFKGADKRTAISEAWVLLTEHYRLPVERLYVTVYHDDLEARQIWENHIGLSSDRVIDCGEADNFWSMGDTGPCGPCTEIFYDHGSDVAGGLPGTPEQEGDRFVEIWNLVFMQYEMLADGTKVELPSMGLDTGMGLERLCAVMQDVHNNFDSDLFTGVIKDIQSRVGINDITTARVISDHLRSSVFLISDQVYPSNEGRGYVLRRIIRRAVGFAYRQGQHQPFMYTLVDPFIEMMASAYPELKEKNTSIKALLKEEEIRFYKTIDHGMKLLEGFIGEQKDIDGQTAFMLYDTYGFPLDIVQDVAKDHGLSVDAVGYLQCMADQQNRSRANQNFSKEATYPSNIETEFMGHTDYRAEICIAEMLIQGVQVAGIQEGQSAMIVTQKTPFYAEGGGQIGDQGTLTLGKNTFEVHDTQKQGKTVFHIGEVTQGAFSVGDTVTAIIDQRRREVMCNHSATHLLHAALRQVVGDHVVQKGSLVNDERLRFDFTHTSPLSAAMIKEIEVVINDQIRRNHEMVTEVMPLAEARKLNIMALFDEKYEDPVRVVRFGEFSAELCGGTHVAATGQIGLFKIIQETGIASGVRRMEAITGRKALEWLHQQEIERFEVARQLKCDQHLIVDRARQLVKDHKALQKAYSHYQQKHYVGLLPEWVSSGQQVNDQIIINQQLVDVDPSSLRSIMEALKSAMPVGVIIISIPQGEQMMTAIGVHGKRLHAGELMLSLTSHYGGKGGGKQNAAQGMLNTQSIENEVINKLIGMQC